MGVKFSQNLEYLLTRPGLMKLMSLVIGLVSMALGVHGIEDSKYNQFVEEELENETFFESSVVGSFLFSFAYLALLCFSDDLANNNINRYVDTIYHALAGQLYSALFSYTMRRILLFVRKPAIRLIWFLGGILSGTLRKGLSNVGLFYVINAVLYELTAYFAYTTKDLT